MIPVALTAGRKLARTSVSSLAATLFTNDASRASNWVSFIPLSMAVRSSSRTLRVASTSGVRPNRSSHDARSGFEMIRSTLGSRLLSGCDDAAGEPDADLFDNAEL